MSNPDARAPAGVPEASRLDALYHAALENLRRGRVDLVHGPLAELQRALPGNQNVRYLERQVAIIGFEWAAARGPLVLEHRDAPAGDAVDVVAFHVNVPQPPSGLHAPIDYMAVLALSFESAQIKAPCARRILLTDENTAVPESVGVDEVLRFPIDTARLMFERMRVQEIYLGARARGRFSVLMDSDIVVNADPTAIFAEAFDVGLTWRPEFPEAPFNGGMIFVGEGEAGRSFFADALRCYDAVAADAGVRSQFPQDLKAWWGDQFALAAMVGYREFAQRSGEALAVEGRRVRFFPCEEYNCALKPGLYSPGELAHKRFIHFKGNRKAMQSRYLEMMRAGQV